MRRNHRLEWIGITGCFASEYALNLNDETEGGPDGLRQLDVRPTGCPIFLAQFHFAL